MGEAADWHRDTEEAQQDALQAELAEYARQREAKTQAAPPSQRREADTEQVVQVRMAGAPRAYGYAWRGAEPLELHEWVMLPGNVVSPEGCKGRVEGFGRGGYTGPLKDVASRIERPDPWVARMQAVTSKAEVRRVWMAAKRAELPADRLQVLIRLGKEALAKRELGSATLENATGAQA